MYFFTFVSSVSYCFKSLQSFYLFSFVTWHTNQCWSRLLGWWLKNRSAKVRHRQLQISFSYFFITCPTSGPRVTRWTSSRGWRWQPGKAIKMTRIEKNDLYVRNHQQLIGLKEFLGRRCGRGGGIAHGGEKRIRLLEGRELDLGDWVECGGCGRCEKSGISTNAEYIVIHGSFLHAVSAVSHKELTTLMSS